VPEPSPEAAQWGGDCAPRLDEEEDEAEARAGARGWNLEGNQWSVSAAGGGMLPPRPAVDSSLWSRGVEWSGVVRLDLKCLMGRWIGLGCKWEIRGY
jgi:hypothetical protein